MAQTSLNSTGVASSGALVLQSNGTTAAMTIDTSQNVGIGTSSPATKLQVAGEIRSNNDISNSSDVTFYSYNGATAGTVQAGIQFVGSGQNTRFYTNSSERARIDSSGNVGIGTSSPSTYGAKLAVYDSGGNGVLSVAQTTSYSQIQSNGYDLYLNQNVGGAGSNSGNTIFRRGSSFTESARIDSSGNLLVGTTTSAFTSGIGHKIRPDTVAPFIGTVGSSVSGGDVTYGLYSTGAAAYRFYVGYNGTINATSIVITAISDQRLKENVRDIDTGLDAVMALKPRRFDWKEGKGQDKKDVAGFIAQEFEEVFPESVGTTKAGEDGIEYKNINHETLIPTLVKAIQELKAIVDTQAQRITALEGAK